MHGLLQAHRLVTLLGPGGVGKTQLALHAARDDPPADGVWLVRLVASQSPLRRAGETLLPLQPLDVPPPQATAAPAQYAAATGPPPGAPRAYTPSPGPTGGNSPSRPISSSSVA